METRSKPLLFQHLLFTHQNSSTKECSFPPNSRRTKKAPHWAWRVRERRTQNEQGREAHPEGPSFRKPQDGDWEFKDPGWGYIPTLCVRGGFRGSHRFWLRMSEYWGIDSIVCCALCDMPLLSKSTGKRGNSFCKSFLLLILVNEMPLFKRLTLNPWSCMYNWNIWICKKKTKLLELFQGFISYLLFSVN